MNKPLADAIEWAERTLYVFSNIEDCRHRDVLLAAARVQAVPRHPTEKMIDAGTYAKETRGDYFVDIWIAMYDAAIAASPINALPHETED